MWLWGTQLFFSSLALEVFYSSFLTSTNRAVGRASPCPTSGSVSLKLGWLHFGCAAEPQSQAGANARDASEKQDTTKHLVVASSAGCVTSASLLINQKKTDMWAVVWRKRKGKRVREKSIGMTQARGARKRELWHGRERTAKAQGMAGKSSAEGMSSPADGDKDSGDTEEPLA